MAVDKASSKAKVAFITGIAGQDGSYLSEILLEKGYEVHGLVRPTSQRRQALNRPLRPGITLHFGDMSDVGRLLQILGSIKVDEVYHLAAQSHVGVSFETPVSTSDTNALGTLRLLEAMRILNMESARFYNASSAELYGSDMPAPQTEETPFHPVSPYAVSKQFQFWTTVNYREAYGFHASNGILFNHESPRRGTTFVTRKITSQVAMIACELSESFELGNLNAVRDWGHAKDYMYGVYLMLQQPKSGDYILASGQARSVRQFVEAAFKVIGVDIKWSDKGVPEVGIDAATSKVRVKVNPEFYRPLENENLLGSPAKARRELNWEPKYNFESLVEEMVLSDINAAKTGGIFAKTYLDWLVDDSHSACIDVSGGRDSNCTDGYDGRESNSSGSNNGHGSNEGEEFASEVFLVDAHDSKGPAQVSCRWRFSEPTTDVYELRHFHCLDLLMTIVSTSCADAQREVNRKGNPIEYATSTALKSIVRTCCTMRPSVTRVEVAIKVILVPRSGFLCRGDILKLRMQGSDFVDSLIQFSASDKYFPALTYGKTTLLGLLSSSPGALLLKQSPSYYETLELLRNDLKLRLSFDWVLPTKPAECRIALIGGRYKYDMKKGSFGHKGTFDAAQGLGISVIVLDHSGHWLEEDQYSCLREDFIAIDMNNDAGLPLRIVEALRGREIDGVVTFSDEVVIPTAKAAEIMSLPTEPVRSFQQAHDKFEARNLLTPGVQFIRLESAEQLNDNSIAERLKALQYPLIVKPCMGGGSRGVKKVNDYSSACQAIRQIEEEGFATGGILIETYVDGPEVDANFVLWDGEILFFEVLDGLPCRADASDATISDNFAETIEVLPSRLDFQEIQNIRSTLHRDLLQLGFRSGVFHVEARMRNSSMCYKEDNGIIDLVDAGSAVKGQPEVFLIEVNARLPGLMAVYATTYTYGVDYCALTLLRALGDRERFIALSKSFSCHAQYWSGLVLIPVHRKNAVVPDDFCNRVIQRVPEIAPHLSRAECLATTRVVSSVGGTGFIGYFLLFSRTSRRHVLEMSKSVQETSKQLLNSF